MTAKEFNENELLFDELYEKTKDCGRVQFINLLMEKERENQELKKQLEEIKSEPLTNRIGRIDSVIANIYSRNRTHKKEFIEWLEKEIEAIENKLNRYNELVKQGKETDFEYYESIIDERKFDIYMKTLRKYKEIIGSEVENNAK